ncbi:MAG: SpoIIIAH-like family protein [Candidatus Merdivicinus sp.]|mgnify:FL=1|jgi:stage III sporulation protein AH
MKLNMILGKKQIVLASLVLVLGVAIYLNYTFSKTGEPYDITTGVSTPGDGGVDTYGEAQLTDAKADEYFTQARLERKKARDEAVETLANTLKDADLSEEDKDLATAKALEVSKQMESEVNIETLVKAKGFADCLAIVDSESVKVVVKTEGLDAEQAAQIKNIILEETDVLAENVSVGEVQ